MKMQAAGLYALSPFLKGNDMEKINTLSLDLETRSSVDI